MRVPSITVALTNAVTNGLPVKVQLTPQILFRLFEFTHFSDHHCEKIIVVAIFVNLLCIFEVRKISRFRGHDRTIAKNGACWLVTSSKDH